MGTVLRRFLSAVLLAAFLCASPALAATRLYLPHTAAGTPISPTPDAGWTDTSHLARTNATTTTGSDALTTLSYSYTSAGGAKYVLFMQYVSPALTAGQTITGSQSLKCQARISTGTGGDFLDTVLSIRVINGSTVKKVIKAATNDGNGNSVTTLTNNQWTATSAATNYTTVSGDYLVIEIGLQYFTAATYTGNLNLGNNSATDLPENNSTTAADNPWVQLTDTLTFVAGATSACGGSLNNGSLTLLGVGC